MCGGGGPRRGLVPGRQCCKRGMLHREEVMHGVVVKHGGGWCTEGCCPEAVVVHR